MESKLERRLRRLLSESDKNESQFLKGKQSQEEYIRNRLVIDRKMVAVYDMDRIKIHNEEFDENQLDMMLGSAGETTLPASL